jgi:hypothetical protein
MGNGIVFVEKNNVKEGKNNLPHLSVKSSKTLCS